MLRNPDIVSTKQKRIAALAKQSPQMRFTSLAYHMDLSWLVEAYHRTRKSGAAGVDGQTWQAYGQSLEVNLQSLLVRAKSGRYKAPPVKRVHIPKAGDPTQTRPIGIPTLEDKVLQRAVMSCWNRSTSTTLSTARTASGPVAARTKRWSGCGKRR